MGFDNSERNFVGGLMKVTRGSLLIHKKTGQITILKDKKTADWSLYVVATQKAYHEVMNNLKLFKGKKPRLNFMLTGRNNTEVVSASDYMELKKFEELKKADPKITKELADLEEEKKNLSQKIEEAQAKIEKILSTFFKK